MATLINDDYKIIRKIDTGATSVVYLALHKPSNIQVAIKLVNKEFFSNLDKFTRFATMLKSINHPFIAKFFDCFESGKYICFVLEYCENGSLEDFLKKNGRLREEKARAIYTQILFAVEYLHNTAHIIHRDIKPQNILFDRNNNIKLIDFGFSENFNCSKPVFDTFCGTPLYLPPEMVNRPKYDTKVDIWSLGVLLHYMVNGDLPFQGQSVDEIYQKLLYSDPDYNHATSQEVNDLIGKMLSKNPDERPTISQVLQHAWLNHGDLICNLRSNVNSFNNYIKGAPVFHSLGEKIAFYDKWKSSFLAGEEVIGIPCADAEKCFICHSMPVVAAYKVTRAFLNSHRMMKKSCSAPTNMEFPRRKSFI